MCVIPSNSTSCYSLALLHIRLAKWVWIWHASTTPASFFVAWDVWPDLYSLTGEVEEGLLLLEEPSTLSISAITTSCRKWRHSHNNDHLHIACCLVHRLDLTAHICPPPPLLLAGDLKQADCSIDINDPFPKSAAQLWQACIRQPYIQKYWWMSKNTCATR